MSATGCGETFYVDESLAGGSPGSSTGGEPATGGLTDDESGGRSNDRGDGGHDGDGGHSELPGGMGGDDSELPPSCDQPEILCEDRCIDPSSDPRYCGATCHDDGDLGQVCGDRQICHEGECVLDCAEDTVECFGECVDPSSNNFYCGASGACTSLAEQGTFCAEDQTCVAGECLGWGDKYEEPEGLAPFATAIREDGLIVWAMNRGDDAAFRVLSAGASRWSEWSSASSPINHIPRYLSCGFTPDGLAAVAYNMDVGFYLSLSEPETLESRVEYGLVTPSGYRDVITDMAEGTYALVVGRIHQETDEDQLVTQALFPTSAEFEEEWDMIFAESAEAPVSVSAVRSMLAGAWRTPDHKEVWFRFLQKGGACCDSVQLSSKEIASVGTPQLIMDLEQNVLIVWGESVGSSWHLRYAFVAAADGSPETWPMNKDMLVPNVASAEPYFVLRGNRKGDAFLSWIQQDDESTNLGYAFRGQGQDWSDVVLLDEHPDLITNPVRPTLDLAMNESARAALVWSDVAGTLWSRFYIPGSGFGSAHVVASERDSMGMVSTEIDGDGRAHVFWAGEGGTLFARSLQ